MKKSHRSRSVLTLAVVAMALVLAANTAPAATVTNAGFETDTFTVFPGYISLNSAVTGWTATTATQQGINPSGGSPFANNGTIPEGTQVGFIQTNGNTNTFSNTITGLTNGQQYELSYRVNARNGQQSTMSVAVGGSTLVSSQVTSVGGANPYGYVVRNFTATGPSMSLAVSGSSPVDQTLLIDDFQVTAKPSTPWSVHAWNDDASSGIDATARFYTHAYNFGTTAQAINTTINGVDFTGVDGGNPSAADFSYVGPNAATNDGANNITTGGSETLADSFVYNGTLNTLTLNGLVDGQTYVTSIFGVGWDTSAPRTATFEANGERLTVNENQFGNNNGIRIDYEFVASGTSQVITIDSLGNNTFHTYGFANFTATPEPSTFALGVLGLLLLGMTPRRRRI